MIQLRSDIYKRRQPLNPATFEELGIVAGAPFAEFHMRYEGQFSSSNTGFCLLELDGSDGFGSILDSTRVVRERFGWPARFLVLTSLLANGVYVYDSINDKIFDVDFEGTDTELLEGRLPPAFESFEEFLQWYFEGEF